MNNFCHSGLYSEPFYKRINNLVFDDNDLFNTICDDYHIFLDAYQNQIDITDNQDAYTICRQIYELLLLEISSQTLYYQPLIFKPDIALECDLIPFVTKYIKSSSNNSLYSVNSNKSYINVLILSRGSNASNDLSDLLPKLDAYQALTDNSIDNKSSLFEDEEHFTSVVGKSLTQKVKFATFI